MKMADKWDSTARIKNNLDFVACKLLEKNKIINPKDINCLSKKILLGKNQLTKNKKYTKRNTGWIYLERVIIGIKYKIL